MKDIKKLLEKVKGRKIVNIVSTIGHHTRTDEGGINLFCGDYDSGGGEVVILLDDGTTINVWASEWGGMTWYKD